MKGSFVFGAEDSGPGHLPASGPMQPFMFHLTISTDDLALFVQDDTYEATAVGWVNSDALGGRLRVERGIFNLFVSEGPRTKRMLYRLFFRDAEGHPLTMAGYKEISGGSFSQVWPETTTLYIRLLRGHVMADGDSSADPVGAGVLHVLPLDFAKQLTTFRAARGPLIDRVRALVDFGDLFAGQLLEAFWPLRRHRTIG
jgi:cholesterol oxidase